MGFGVWFVSGWCHFWVTNWLVYFLRSLGCPRPPPPPRSVGSSVLEHGRGFLGRIWTTWSPLWICLGINAWSCPTFLTPFPSRQGCAGAPETLWVAGGWGRPPPLSLGRAARPPGHPTTWGSPHRRCHPVRPALSRGPTAAPTEGDPPGAAGGLPAERGAAAPQPVYQPGVALQTVADCWPRPHPDPLTREKCE